jgi:hypothetical protein
MWTNGGLRRVLDGTLNLTTATLKVMLLDTGYVPDPDHEFVASLAANELSGTGYTAGFGGAGRKTLAGKTFTKDDTLDEARFDATDPTWAGADFGTVGCAAIINEVTSNADSPVLALLPVSPTVLTSGGTLTLTLGTYAMKLTVG